MPALQPQKAAMLKVGETIENLDQTLESITDPTTKLIVRS